MDVERLLYWPAAQDVQAVEEVATVEKYPAAAQHVVRVMVADPAEPTAAAAPAALRDEPELKVSVGCTYELPPPPLAGNWTHPHAPPPPE